MRIDLHTHFYPIEYLRTLEEKGDGFEFATDSFGRTIVKKVGTRFFTVTPPMQDPELRFPEMDAAGVDVAVLSLSAPSVYFAPDELGHELSRVTNEKLVELRDRYPKRFMCFATTPLQNPEMAVEELRRAITKLGMNGVIVGSNINGKPLNSPEYEQFWATASDLEIPVLLHPMPPLGGEMMKEYGLAPLVGFIFDSDLAAARMIFDGIFERYPNMKFILPHLGGAITILMERWDHGFREYPDCRVRISKPPSYYLKKMFFDVVCFHKPALMCCYSSVGASQMVLGSDYPHVIGDIYRCVSSVSEMDISEDEKELIYGGNARRILKMN